MFDATESEHMDKRHTEHARWKYSKIYSEGGAASGKVFDLGAAVVCSLQYKGAETDVSEHV